jgi:hypothetical protein
MALRRSILGRAHLAVPCVQHIYSMHLSTVLGQTVTVLHLKMSKMSIFAHSHYSTTTALEILLTNNTVTRKSFSEVVI